jgi:hypothetical protein
MKYLKSFLESIYIPNYYHLEEVEDHLNELELTIDDLNDIFIEVIDLGFGECYLQRHYVSSSDGSRWINIKDGKAPKGNYHVFLGISFRKESDSLKTDVKSRFGQLFYQNETDTTKAFLSSVDRLKSMLPKNEILWNFTKGEGYISCEVCIYIDDIKN